MEKTMILIRGMIGRRCVLWVQSVLTSLGLAYEVVSLDGAILRAELSDAKRKALRKCLLVGNLYLLDVIEGWSTEKIKFLCHVWEETVHDHNPITRSAYLVSQLGGNDDAIGVFFKANEGVVISQFCLKDKLRRAMLMLLNTTLTLTEIYIELHYPSEAYFCRRFFISTKQTPTQFRIAGVMPV